MLTPRVCSVLCRVHSATVWVEPRDWNMYEMWAMLLMPSAVCIISYRHVSQKDAFVPPESCSTNLLCSICCSGSHTPLCQPPPPLLYTELCCRHAYFSLVSLSRHLCFSHTHTCRCTSHRIWRKMGFLWAECVSHCSPCTCPLTYNSLRRDKAARVQGL